MTNVVYHVLNTEVSTWQRSMLGGGFAVNFIFGLQILEHFRGPSDTAIISHFQASSLIFIPHSSLQCTDIFRLLSLTAFLISVHCFFYFSYLLMIDSNLARGDGKNQRLITRQQVRVIY
jgi:hypothetical protein